MILNEYHSKLLLTQFGIAVPRGKIIYTPTEAYEFALELGGSVVIKGLNSHSNHHQCGIIEYADSPDEARQKTHNLLSQAGDGGNLSEKLLIESKYTFSTKICLHIANMEATGTPIITAALINKTEPEIQPAITSWHAVASEQIHPHSGLQNYQGRNIASGINLSSEHWNDFSNFTKQFAQCYLAYDAIFAKISSLVITDNQKFVALDSEIYIDDYAVFRHPDLSRFTEANPTLTVPRSRTTGLHYTQLNGQIGCVANGAGLAMATLDAVYHYGGEEIRSASIVDIGTETSESNLQKALNIITSKGSISAILINLFGVITSCDQVARILLRSLQNIPVLLPVIIRLGGYKAEEGLEILRSANGTNLRVSSSLVTAAGWAVEAARGDHP